MAISFNRALGIREHSLQLRADRANILSNNLANVDTPHFKARDVDFQQELASRMGENSIARVTTTRLGHIGTPAFLDSPQARLYRVPSQPSIDGNSVEEHVEHAEFMKNSLEFQLAFTLLNGGFKGLRKAIKGE